MITLKKIASFCLLSIILFAGCKKDNTSTNTLGNIPAHFAKRVLLEENTGEWCSECPYGGDSIVSLKAQYGESIAAVSIHNADFLDMSAIYDTIGVVMQQPISAFPTAATDRTTPASGDYWDDRSSWGYDVQAELAIDNNTGLAMITSIQGSTATIEVHVAYHTSNTYNMRLNVYLVENNIPQQSQANAPANYMHQQVLRQIATPIFGDPVSMSSGAEIVKKYQVPITGYIASNLVAVAFIEKWGSAVTDRAVFNCREVALGQTAVWQ